MALPWTADRNTPDNGEPDSEEFVPKSDVAPVRVRGKTSAHADEGDSDDVQILEVVTAMPISYAFRLLLSQLIRPVRCTTASLSPLKLLLPRGSAPLRQIPPKLLPRSERRSLPSTFRSVKPCPELLGDFIFICTTCFSLSVF